MAADSHAQLMQLIPLFEETKQFLRKVETVDRSQPVLSGAGGDSSSALEEAEQDIRILQATVARLQAENDALRGREAAAAQLTAAVVGLRASLRGMGDAAEAWLAVAEGVPPPAPEPASSTAAPPRPPAAPLPPPHPPPSAAADGGGDGGGSVRIDVGSVRHGALMRDIQRHTPKAAPMPPPPPKLVSEEVGRARLAALAMTGELRAIFDAANVDFQQAFSLFDADGDGIITPAEFGEGIRRLDLDISEQQLQQLIETIDSDGSGGLDYQEFAAQFEAIDVLSGSNVVQGIQKKGVEFSHAALMEEIEARGKKAAPLAPPPPPRNPPATSFEQMVSLCAHKICAWSTFWI